MAARHMMVGLLVCIHLMFSTGLLSPVPSSCVDDPVCGRVAEICTSSGSHRDFVVALCPRKCGGCNSSTPHDSRALVQTTDSPSTQPPVVLSASVLPISQTVLTTPASVLPASTTVMTTPTAVMPTASPALTTRPPQPPSVGVCSNSVCLNGGTCHPKPGFTFECMCPTSHSGPLCQTPTQATTTQPQTPLTQPQISVQNHHDPYHDVQQNHYHIGTQYNGPEGHQQEQQQHGNHGHHHHQQQHWQHHRRSLLTSAADDRVAACVDSPLCGRVKEICNGDDQLRVMSLCPRKCGGCLLPTTGMLPSDSTPSSTSYETTKEHSIPSTGLTTVSLTPKPSSESTPMSSSESTPMPSTVSTTPTTTIPMTAAPTLFVSDTVPPPQDHITLFCSPPHELDNLEFEFFQNGRSVGDKSSSRVYNIQQTNHSHTGSYTCVTYFHGAPSGSSEAVNVTVQIQKKSSTSSSMTDTTSTTPHIHTSTTPKPQTTPYPICNFISPCLNGGTCYQHADYTLECKCAVGYSGPFCITSSGVTTDSPVTATATATAIATATATATATAILPATSLAPPMATHTCPSSVDHDGCSPAEVVFMVEYSKHESTSDIEDEGDMIKVMVDKYHTDSAHVRIGVVVFHDDVTEAIHITDFSNDKEGLKTRISSLTRAPCYLWNCWWSTAHQSELMPSGEPDISKAFDFVRENSFKGARPGALRIVIPIFHSMSRLGSDQTRIMVAAQKLKNDCAIITANVVTDGNSQLNKDLVKNLVTQPYDRHYFEHTHFSYGGLKTAAWALNFNCPGNWK